MISHDLMELMPGVEGFTRKNLQNATRFYRFYSAAENRKQLVSKSQVEDSIQNRKQDVSKLEQTPDSAIFRIPWGHHIVIFGKCVDIPADTRSPFPEHIRSRTQARRDARLMNDE